MTDWLHNLSVPWMALAVFATTYFLAAAIFAVVNLIAKAERARAFKAISPGLLPPLGILFGLFVAFTAAQVWSDIDRAIAMVHIDNRRGSAIAMGIFANGIAVSALLIAAHDRPFTGQISVGPDPLLQLLPKGNTGCGDLGITPETSGGDAELTLVRSPFAGAERRSGSAEQHQRVRQGDPNAPGDRKADREPSQDRGGVEAPLADTH